MGEQRCSHIVHTLRVANATCVLAKSQQHMLEGRGTDREMIRSVNILLNLLFILAIEDGAQTDPLKNNHRGLVIEQGISSFLYFVEPLADRFTDECTLNQRGLWTVTG